MRNHRTSPKPTRATDGEGHSKSDSTVGGEWKRRFREEMREGERAPQGGLKLMREITSWLGGSGCNLREMQLIFLRVCIGPDLNLQTCPV